MADIKNKIEVSLNLMPAFYTKHIGIKYGRDFYYDPEYRGKVEAGEYGLLKDILADYGICNEKFVPSANIFIQAVDLILRTQGADWRFPEDATVESVGTPWADMNIEEISRIDPRDASNHQVINDIIEQYRQLQKLYGDRADIFWAKSGVMNIHTPYTTAHQLCGENLFILMLCEPHSVTIIFEKIWDIYKAIFDRIREVTGACFSKVQMGDCSASMLSLELYQNVVAPFNAKIARQFTTVGYHSCGPSTHLLNGFRQLPVLSSIELGPGTDLVSAAQLMPATIICPLVDPLVMRDGSAESVEEMVAGIVRDTQNACNRLLCAWSFDSETPFENIKALYREAKG